MGILMTYSGGQITGEDLYFENFKLSEALCDAEQITFGSCIASKIKFTISNKQGLLNRKDLTVTLNGTQVGVYRVYSDEPDLNSPYREITAYDALYRINNAQLSSWYDSQFANDATPTLKQFRDSFFQHFGIAQQDNITLVNDAMVVRKTLEPTTLYGKDIIRDICEINGVFGHINAQGVFCYISPLDATTVSVSASGVESIKYENYVAEAINKLVIRGSSDDVGASYGSGTNVYYVTGNMFALGLSATELATVAQKLSTRVFGVSYRPFEAEINGANVGCLGQSYTIQGTQSLLVLEHEMEGILAPHSTISAQGREEWREEKSTDEMESEVRVISSQTNELRRDVDGTMARVSTIEGDYVTETTYTQNANAVQLQFTNVNTELQRITEELDGEAFVYELDYQPTLLNYPAWDFTYNIPCNDTVQTTNDLKFVYNDDYYRKNTRDLAFDTTTSYSYRFVKDGGVWQWKMVADSDFGIAMAKIATLEGDAETLSATVREQGLVIDGQGVRLTTAEGNITTQSTQIAAKVSKAEGDATTSCSWDLTTDAFKVYSNGTEVLKVDGSGLNVTGSGTFSGTVTSSDATINGGSISIKNGSNVETFKVSNTGHLKATDAEIEGTIKSSNAQITGGTLSVGDNFSVTNEGTLTVNGADIKGSNIYGSGVYLVHGDAGAQVTTTALNATGDGNDTHLNVGGESESNCIGQTDIYGRLKTIIHAEETETSGSLKVDGDLTVEEDATIIGDATIDGDVTVNGDVSVEQVYSVQVYAKAQGGQQTRINGDSLNAYNADGTAGTLHLNYGGGVVKISAGAPSNVGVGFEVNRPALFTKNVIMMGNNLSLEEGAVLSFTDDDGYVALTIDKLRRLLALIGE